ncbi:MAG: META domain-containing protein [Pseudomonadota bacterium]
MSRPAPALEIDTIDGTATYADDGVLPRDAVLEVDLIDRTRQGERGRVLSRMRFSPQDGVPIDFELSYDMILINPRGTYLLVARIIDKGEVLYRSAAGFQVFTSQFEPRPELVLEPVTPLVHGGSPVGHKWRVTQIDGVKAFGFTKTTLVLDEDGTMKGNAGCNRFDGTYRVDGDKLDLGEPIRTKRGCSPDIMDRERGFVMAVRRTERYERDGDTLYLFDNDGLEAMRLVRE